MGKGLERRIRLQVRMFALFSVLLASCFGLSGCDLFSEIVTWMEKALGNYSNQSSVGILVYPPFPDSFFEAKSQPVMRTGFIFSENVKNALMNGVEGYNQIGKQQVKAWYMKDEEMVRSIYNEYDFGDPKANFSKVIEDARAQGDQYRDISAIIFGTFDDVNDNATSYKCSLGLFDYRKRSLAEQVGPVSKDAGRVQEKELENLMTELLKKVYQ